MTQPREGRLSLVTLVAWLAFVERKTMINIYFDVPSYFFEDCETYEYFYRKDKEVLDLLNQLDIDYDPEMSTLMYGRDSWEYGYYEREVDPEGKTSVTVNGSAKVLDKLATSLKKECSDFLEYWVDADPWFLSEAVELADMDSSDAAFFLDKYGEAIPEDLRAEVFGDLVAVA